jgi:hypothetical protein
MVSDTPNVLEDSVERAREPVQPVNDSTSPDPRKTTLPPVDTYASGPTRASLAFKAGLDAWRKERDENKTPKPEDESDKSDNAGGVAAQPGSDYEPRAVNQKDGGKSVP